ncbi:MAG: hypothetical protein HFH26_09060 [Clostridiaceae bacterium]|nr:hypothetical protein [Clostridiaceae bacterium]
MHSFLCFSKIGSLHDIDLYLGSLSLDNCDFDSKQLSLPVAISTCRAAPMGANPLGHTFKPLTLYDISIYTIYFSHPAAKEERTSEFIQEASDGAALYGVFQWISCGWKPPD